MPAPAPPSLEGQSPEGAARTELDRSEGRFHLLVDAVRDYAIFMLDPRGYVISWNAGAERLKGYTEREIVGQHFSRFYPPEDVARGVPADVLREAATTGHFQTEGWRVRKDGTRFWADVTVTAIEDEAGELIGFAKVTRDLTRRHAAQEELRLSEERFRLLMEGVIDYAIFMIDPQGIVVSWNAGAERLKGYTEREIVGQHFSRFYPPEDVAAGKPQRVLAEAARAGRFEDEGWRVRKDGTRFWANVVITALRDESGTLRGFAKVTRDLTERRRAEEERRRRQAAEEVARLRGEFLSVAAHELKTPLTSLRGMAQLTLRRYAREGDVSPERVVRALRQIVDQTSKLGRLVDQLLDVTRLEAGHLVLDRLKTDVGALAASIVDAYQARGDGDRIGLDLPDHPIWAFVDALRIEQVVINLIDNALKFSPEGSPVRVSVTEVGPGRVRITVADRGPGVAPEERPHLFDLFFRSPATAYTSGMGLGLYISRQIVMLHGGTVRADFPPEGGTRVVVELDAGLDAG